MASHFNILSLKHTCIYVYVTITYFGDTLQQGPIIQGQLMIDHVSSSPLNATFDFKKGIKS